MASTNLSFLVVDNISYLLHPQPLAKIVEPWVKSDPIPVVLFTTSAAAPPATEVRALIHGFADVDDVYAPPFSDTLVLQLDSSLDAQRELGQYRDSGCFEAVYHIAPNSPPHVLPTGPYFLTQGNIHQAYRLYEDELDSFIFGVIPEDVLNPKK
ncbi:unnamed protein product [Clonostachys rosea f. rosea IK726]|uniref:Uncharacterized protein n=1 Tax=Clonostachys rosea f. rosea IK726 TaxID=1349383 RepID=A0ACA9TMG0_BIOOC|nr:unnamed protein product [Clonostachys rosea f. rosea IK726]